MPAWKCWGAQDCNQLRGVKRLGFHLYCELLAALWDFQDDINIIFPWIFLQTVCAIMHCSLKLVIDRLEYLEHLVFLPLRRSYHSSCCIGDGCDVYRFRTLSPYQMIWRGSLSSCSYSVCVHNLHWSLTPSADSSIHAFRLPWSPLLHHSKTYSAKATSQTLPSALWRLRQDLYRCCSYRFS